LHLLALVAQTQITSRTSRCICGSARH